MGCAESRDNENNNNKKVNDSDNNTKQLNRLQLLTSSSSTIPTLQTENDLDYIKTNQLLDSYILLFQQSDLSKNELFIKHIQEMNRLKLSQYPTINYEQFNNPYLYRFLKANHFDINKAKHQFESHIKWRETFNVDNIHNDFVFFESDDVQQLYPHGYHKTDKEGRPIYIEILKDITLERLYKITTQDRLKRHYIQCYEQLINKILPSTSIHHQKFISQTFTILDAKDISLKPMEAKNFLSLLTSVSTQNYPEIMGKLYVVNSPLLAQVFWKVISIMLNDHMKSKIFILGKDYKSKLLEYIDKENLPDFLGGESDTQNGALLRKNIGSWNDYGKQILFPHEDEERMKNITEEERQELLQQIEQQNNKRSSIKQQAQERNSVSQRQSIQRIKSATPNTSDASPSLEINHPNILDNLEKESIS